MQKWPDSSMIRTEQLHPAGTDSRGTTFGLPAYNRTGEYILAYRVAGSVSGRHYHTGISAHKDPEILYLVSGSLQLNYRELSEVWQVQRTLEINAPARITIEKNTWHEVIALSDIVFLELNSLQDGDHDTHRIATEEEKWKN